MDSFIGGVLERLRTVFDPEAMGSGVAQLSANLLVAVITMAGFVILWRLVRWVVLATLRQTKVDETNSSFVLAMLQFGLFTIATIQSLTVAGVNVAALAASVGIAGLTLGFAARDSLSNIVSGVMVFWDRPFVIGDLVEIGDHYGTVERITLRSTRIVTPDGRMLAVPNTSIVNTIVASYTNFPNLRIDIPFTIGSDEDINRVRRILLKLVEDRGDFMALPKPTVVLTSINDFNLTLELSAWIEAERGHILKRSSLREAVLEELRSAGIDMPCETLALKPIEVHKSAA